MESLRIVYSCLYLVMVRETRRVSGLHSMSMELVIREFLGNHPQWVGSGVRSGRNVRPIKLMY